MKNFSILHGLVFVMLYLNKLLIVVTFNRPGVLSLMAIISKLPGAIGENRQRIKAVNYWETQIATTTFFFVTSCFLLKNL